MCFYCQSSTYDAWSLFSLPLPAQQGLGCLPHLCLHVYQHVHVDGHVHQHACTCTWAWTVTCLLSGNHLYCINLLTVCGRPSSAVYTVHVHVIDVFFASHRIITISWQHSDAMTLTGWRSRYGSGPLARPLSPWGIGYVILMCLVLPLHIRCTLTSTIEVHDVLGLCLLMNAMCTKHLLHV